MLPADTPIAVAGAGSVGCYVGGMLAAAGRTVTLLARPSLAEAITGKGFRLSDLDGGEISLSPGSMAATSDPAKALRAARVILLTVKSGDTAEMAGLIRDHASPEARVVSLQNGVGNVEALAAVLGPGRIVQGMVPFNVARLPDVDGTPAFHRGTSGSLHVARQPDGLAALLTAPSLACIEHDDMAAVAWSKLLLNLNNALNALSGRPLYDQLSDRASRLALADQMDEAMMVLDAAGIRPVRIEGVAPGIVPRVLRLPTWLFRIVARRMMAIDRRARSSMAEDFERGRRTEIDYLQGAVVRLAESLGRDAPICRAVLEQVKAREAPISSSGRHRG